MDTARIIVTLGGLTLIGFTLWFFFGVRDEAPPAKVAAPGPEQPLYACPMHAWITSADPAANCSICGMQLTRQANAPRGAI